MPNNEEFIETDPGTQAYQKNLELRALGYTGPMLSAEDLTSTAPEHIRALSKARAFVDEIKLQENLRNGTYKR